MLKDVLWLCVFSEVPRLQPREPVQKRAVLGAGLSWWRGALHTTCGYQGNAIDDIVNDNDYDNDNVDFDGDVDISWCFSHHLLLLTSPLGSLWQLFFYRWSNGKQKYEKLKSEAPSHIRPMLCLRKSKSATSSLVLGLKMETWWISPCSTTRSSYSGSYLCWTFSCWTTTKKSSCSCSISPFLTTRC